MGMVQMADKGYSRTDMGDVMAELPFSREIPLSNPQKYIDTPKTWWAVCEPCSLE